MIRSPPTAYFLKQIVIDFIRKINHKKGLFYCQYSLFQSSFPLEDAEQLCYYIKHHKKGTKIT